MIKLLFTQFFIKADKKKNTLLIKGVSNSGKTEFLKRLLTIFPSEEYVQQNNSTFSIDYKLRAKYDFTKFYPSFIIVDEGAYNSFFVTGDLSDTKQLMEGKGCSLQQKGKTIDGNSWVGVPIIMAVNNYHYYL